MIKLCRLFTVHSMRILHKLPPPHENKIAVLFINIWKSRSGGARLKNLPQISFVVFKCSTHQISLYLYGKRCGFQKILCPDSPFRFLRNSRAVIITYTARLDFRNAVLNTTFLVRVRDLREDFRTSSPNIEGGGVRNGKTFT